MRPKRPIAHLLCGLLTLLLAAAAGAQGQVGEQAPPFSANTLYGTPVSLAEHLGKRPVHLVFWATWCPNCLREIPAVNALHAHYGERLAIIAINVGIDDSAQKARDYRERHGMGYPVVFDAGSRITRDYAIVGTPTQILVGADGTIAYRSNETPLAEDIDANWSRIAAP